jgi:hypothetical protein
VTAAVVIPLSLVNRAGAPATMTAAEVDAWIDETCAQVPAQMSPSDQVVLDLDVVGAGICQWSNKDLFDSTPVVTGAGGLSDSQTDELMSLLRDAEPGSPDCPLIHDPRDAGYFVMLRDVTGTTWQVTVPAYGECAGFKLGDDVYWSSGLVNWLDTAMNPEPSARESTLQHMQGQSALPGKVTGTSGYLSIRNTPEGPCAALTTAGQKSNRFQGFLWPQGFKVMQDGRNTKVVDRHGDWIANEGDFLYVRGREVAETTSVRQRCAHRYGQDIVVNRVSEPGQQFGSSRKAVVLLDCQGMPRVRPNDIMLACDGGWTLYHVTYDQWGPSGIAGTATASGACSVSSGFHDEPVTFAYPNVNLFHALLTPTHPPDVQYMNGNPCA